MAKKSYPVLSNLQHDGVDYVPGTDQGRVEIDEKIAAPLVEAGVLGEGKPVKETAEQPKK